MINESAAARYGLNADDIRATLRNRGRRHRRDPDSASAIGSIGVRVRYPDELPSRPACALRGACCKRRRAPRAAGAVAEMRWGAKHRTCPRAAAPGRSRHRARWRASTSAPRSARSTPRLAKMVLPAGVRSNWRALQQQQRAFHQLALVMASRAGDGAADRAVGVGRLAPALATVIAALACLAGSFAALRLPASRSTFRRSWASSWSPASPPRTASCCSTAPSAASPPVSRRHGAGRRGDGAAAADRDDHAGDGSRPVAARTRLRRGGQGPAAAGGGGDRRVGARDAALLRDRRRNLLLGTRPAPPGDRRKPSENRQ